MLTNNQTKLIKELHTRKGRLEQSLFLVEGEKLVSELMTQNVHCVMLLVQSDKHFLLDRLPKKTEPIWIAPKLMERLSTFKSPPGIIAVCEMPLNPTLQNEGWFFALDKLQDPGNLGTIIRIADWFGFSGIVADPQTVDAYNTKTVQASMGSIFRVPIYYQPLLPWLTTWKPNQVFLAHINGHDLRNIAEFPKNGVLVIGSESQGLQTELIESDFNTISIPRFGSAESLNAAVAAGILASTIQLNRPIKS